VDEPAKEFPCRSACFPETPDALSPAGTIVSSAVATARVTKAPGPVNAGDTASTTVAVTPRARCTIGVYSAETTTSEALHALGETPVIDL